MKFAAITLASLLAAQSATAADDVSQAALRTAAQKGLDLLVKTSPTFIKKGGCNSCHAQMLPAAAQPSIDPVFGHEAVITSPGSCTSARNRL